METAQSAERFRRPPAARRPWPRRPLTVAHVTGETHFSGGEVQLFLLMEGLRRLGHRNALLCPRASRSAAEAARRDFAHGPIRVGSEWRPGNIASVRRQLRACAPDLVHLHTGRANWLGGLAAWQLGLPAITTRRMDRPITRGLRTRFVYRVGVQRAVAISESVRRRLDRAGVPASMIRLIPSGVDADALLPRSTRVAKRAELGCEPDTPCLLAVAALVRRKGIDVLIEAFSRLARRRPNPLLWVAGEGPSRRTLSRLALRRQLADRVRWLGRRGDIPDLLAACDVFVLPSRQEGLGVAALEAMAAGRPVVASRVGGLAEAVIHGRTGWLVEPDDPQALAAALARLLEDRSLRARLGAAGHARARTHFRAEHMIDAYERLYLEVLDAAGHL